MTAFGHRGPRIAVGYERSLTGALSVQADIGVFRTSDQRDDYLLDASTRWADRTQVVSTVTAALSPVHVRVLGTEHRLGLTLGVAARYKDEQLYQSTFFPQYFLGTPPGSADRIVREWEALGDGYRAIRQEYDDGPDGRQDGTYVSLIVPERGFDPGWTVGARYEVRTARVAYGVDAAYRRFLDQRLLVGSHTADVMLRVGYRF